MKKKIIDFFKKTMKKISLRGIGGLRALFGPNQNGHEGGCMHIETQMGLGTLKRARPNANNNSVSFRVVYCRSFGERLRVTAPSSLCFVTSLSPSPLKPKRPEQYPLPQSHQRHRSSSSSRSLKRR